MTAMRSAGQVSAGTERMLVDFGKAAASKRLRAQMLLATDTSQPKGSMVDTDIACVLGASVRSIERMRCALAEHGLQVAVHGWPAHRREPQGKLDGWAETHLVATACSESPEGTSRWTLALLGEHLVGLKLVESISQQTVDRVLKKQTQALAGRSVVHTAGAKRGLCLCHGGRAGGSQPAC